MKPKMLFTLIRLVIAIAMVLYLMQMGVIDWTSLSGLIIAWPYTLLAVILFFVATILQALRLQILINAHQMSLSYMAAVKLTLIGLFFSTYLPGATGGDLIKIYYASKENPGSKAEVITILFLDRFMGLFSLLTLPVFLAPFFIDLIRSQEILQALLILSLSISSSIVLITFIAAKFELADSKLIYWLNNKVRYGHFLSRALHTIHYYKRSLGPLLKALAISYFLQLLMVGVSFSIAEATNIFGADLKMLFLIPMGYMANSFPLTPGGLGIGEAAMESLFLLGGLTGGAETLLGWRLIMILVGLLGLVYYLKGSKKFFSTP
ncbi:lysylphosphatidylglycerol synthase transmembrane domain-containing protein [Cycloclasticus sp.]|uniref:lysylphosphatidylglycerol synthase transmembrane domain-containing protein n=1 Tax=Cycloclasticus sp. TaxID=2024830 RepID=UPI00257EDA95|nr:lysylphosphatidylglycerol synthase transmembrane domain-containing protein [Cycloclasticus sp.]